MEPQWIPGHIYILNLLVPRLILVSTDSSVPAEVENNFVQICCWLWWAILWNFWFVLFGIDFLWCFEL